MAMSESEWETNQEESQFNRGFKAAELYVVV